LQIAQFLGAIAILSAFFLSQKQVLRQDGYAYLFLNFVGSVVLASVALDGPQWGFLLLNTAWGAVAAWSILGKLRRVPQAG
jgi:hypothetical protein